RSCTDVEPQILDRRRRVVGEAPTPEMIAAHREHTGDRTCPERARTVDRKNDDPLPLVVLIPELRVASVAVHVRAKISIVGDLADRVAGLVDSTGEDAPRRSL